LRLERLDDTTTTVVTEASFLGDGALIDELRIVHRARGGDDGDVDRALTAPTEWRVFTADDDRYTFTHSQIRHLLAHRPREGDREALHRDIAAALVDHYGETAPEHAL